MKYSLSNIIKDLLAKIPVLENRINTLSTKITVLLQNRNDKYFPSIDSNDGYAVLDNSLLLQWGRIDNVYFDESHQEIVTFIKPFPHQCFSVLASTNQNTIVDGMRTVYVVSYDQTQAVFLPGYTKEKYHCSITWFAIGW